MSFSSINLSGLENNDGSHFVITIQFQYEDITLMKTPLARMMLWYGVNGSGVDGVG